MSSTSCSPSSSTPACSSTTPSHSLGNVSLGNMELPSRPEYFTTTIGKTHLETSNSPLAELLFVSDQKNASLLDDIFFKTKVTYADLKRSTEIFTELIENKEAGDFPKLFQTLLQTEPGIHHIVVAYGSLVELGDTLKFLANFPRPELIKLKKISLVIPGSRSFSLTMSARAQWFDRQFLVNAAKIFSRSKNSSLDVAQVAQEETIILLELKALIPSGKHKHEAWHTSLETPLGANYWILYVDDETDYGL